MINAKDELLGAIGERKVKCIHLYTSDYSDAHHAYLPVGHTEEQFQMFLNALNHKYDNGYGGQNLYGHIWYTDGTWSERGEYDGSEWWSHKQVPELPAELQQLSLPQL